MELAKLRAALAAADQVLIVVAITARCVRPFLFRTTGEIGGCRLMDSLSAPHTQCETSPQKARFIVRVGKLFSL